MTPLAGCRGFSWTPDGSREPTLRDIDLRIEPGERVLLAGPSGSGKSTLLRALAGLLHVGAGGHADGEVVGRVTSAGGQTDDVGRRPPQEGAAGVGLLVQDPRDALVAATVGRNVAFGCENAALPRPAIWSAVRSALRAVCFPYGPAHSATAVSGGEAQRRALAGVIAARPDLLLLDEPTSMLDPASAAAVRDAVRDAIAGTQVALVVVEHRLRDWLPLLRRMIVLDESGRLVADGPIDTVLARHGESLTRAGVWVPGVPDPEPLDVPVDLVRPSGSAPFGSVAPAASAPTGPAASAPTPPASSVPTGPARQGGSGPAAPDSARPTGPAETDVPGAGCLRAWDLRLDLAAPLRFTGVRAPAASTRALDGVDATVTAGRLLALCGGSGAGKSSLIAALCGFVQPTGGQVRAGDWLADGLSTAPHRWRSSELAARIGWVPQDATANVVGSTVRDCLLATVGALTTDPAQAQREERRVERLADLLGLTPLLHRNPHQLSGGEARRLAVAAGMAHGPPVLCLDEPTVGQDRNTWAAVVGLILAARAGGAGAVVSTHDEVLAALADHRLDLQGGRVAP